MYSQQGIRSEMQKVYNPYTGGFNRESYFTDMSLRIHNVKLDITTKVDTGATYTVIGLKHKKLNQFKNLIMQSGMHGVAYDASGTELRLYGYIVSDFKLTQDITIGKIKLFFSEDIEDRALLGMDILSLFDFQYLKEKRQNYGTFWINNYEEALKELSERSLNKDIGYIDPILIANIEDQ